MGTKTSRIPGLHKLSISQRRREVAAFMDAPFPQAWISGGMDDELADRFVENAVGRIGMAVGVAANFVVNGADVLVPMAIEEPSVVAAASHAAKMVRAGGGFVADPVPSITVAQIEVLRPLRSELTPAQRAVLLDAANETQPDLVARGGGAVDLEVRADVGADRCVVHLAVDCRDAMGANMVNTMAEAIAPQIARILDGRVGLRILTNLADRRVATVRCRVPVAALARGAYGGAQVAAGVVAASDFAWDDPYRAATHNKGIFNGIDAVLVATGNDWRAVEAGGHAFAARTGVYRPLSRWTLEEDALCGELSVPMAVGVVGGASRHHPAAAAAIALLGADTAEKLAQVTAACGLATNLAALAALATEGIQAGHMRLHARRL